MTDLYAPVPATVAETGPIDLMPRTDKVELAWAIAATVALVVAVGALIVGLVVTL